MVTLTHLAKLYATFSFKEKGHLHQHPTNYYEKIKVVLNLVQDYLNSLSFNDFNFFELNKNPKLFSNIFNCSNISFKEAVSVSTTTKK